MDNKTLIYSPKVEAYVMTKGDRIIDLSKDIIGGSVRRVTNGVSTASLTLNNKDRRYTGKLERMDRIYIRAFKGSQEYGLFMGYLTTVPVFDAYPVNAVIEAQCTLKQIMHTFWDPTSPDAVEKFIVEQHPLRQTVIPYNPVNPTPGEPGSVRIVGTEDQQRLVSEALSWLGKLDYTNDSRRNNPAQTRYADCSSFLTFIYDKVFGMDIGKISYRQAEAGAHVMSGGSSISNIDISKLQPGDIIAYNWAGARWRSTYDHVAMYVGDGQRIDHGSGRGPKLFPVDKVYQPMVKWTVRRHISPGYNLGTPGGSLNAGINVGHDFGSGGDMGLDHVPEWDDRAEYFEQQVADGMGGIRVKGFLNEVCGWPYDRILIEPVPEKLANMVSEFQIVEGASDPEEMIQQVYRTIMGDTFSNSQQQSETVLDPNGFTGSEGQGDSTYTRTMYGIAKVVSNLNYTTKGVSYIPGGSGAYGLTTKHFHGTEAHTRPKASQDAKMLGVLRGFVNSGTPKTVVALAEAYFDDVELPNINNTGSVTWTSGGNRTLALEVRKEGANAPVPKLLNTNSTFDQSSSFDVSQGSSELDLYLKGLRETESGGDYRAQAPNSSASGAYQYITSTWNYEGGEKYAKDASPAVQDARARRDAIDSYNRFKDWEMVAANHIYPAWADKKHLWHQSPGNGNPTIREYVGKVLRYMSGASDLGIDSNPIAGNVGQGDLMDMSMYAFFKQVNYNNDMVSQASELLSGEKALMNDQSAMDFVKTLVKGSMREFQSDREGNFMAFYPDHFGMYKDNPSEGIVPIQDVEIKNFTIRATDTIYTHVYTLDHSEYPDLLWRSNSTAPKDLDLMLQANGVITFENEKMIETILGWKPNRVRNFLQRFGGRPHTERALEITNKTFSKVFTIATFLERWAGQYNTSVDFTFMPELWPGNRASIGSTNVAVYVDSVTHNFSYSSGFTTTATISSPQSIGPNNFDLPKGAF